MSLLGVILNEVSSKEESNEAVEVLDEVSDEGPSFSSSCEITCTEFFFQYGVRTFPSSSSLLN